MIHILKEVRVLRQEGKVHKKLLSRVRSTFLIALVLVAIVLFNIFFRQADLVIASALAIVGFIFGFFLFSRMNGITWNEQEESVQLLQMNGVGYSIIALYIVFEIGLRTFVNSVFPASALVFLLAGVFGSLFGRTMGMIMRIHEVYRVSHA